MTRILLVFCFSFSTLLGYSQTNRTISALSQSPKSSIEAFKADSAKRHPDKKRWTDTFKGQKLTLMYRSHFDSLPVLERKKIWKNKPYFLIVDDRKPKN